MKKTLLFLFLLLLAPLLIGCGALYAQRREVEQLQVMETLGLDPAPGGVVLSLASSSGVGEGKALCYSAAGASCSDAMDRLRSRSLEELLFCGHLQHILIGEEAARQGLDGFLAFVCRSSDLRLDMPMYLVLDTSAEDTMRTTGAGEKNIADALTAMEEDRDKDSRLSTAGTAGPGTAGKQPGTDPARTGRGGGGPGRGQNRSPGRLWGAGRRETDGHDLPGGRVGRPAVDRRPQPLSPGGLRR